MAFGIGKDFEKNLGKDINDLNIVKDQNQPPANEPPVNEPPVKEPPVTSDTKIPPLTPAEPTKQEIDQEAVFAFLKKNGHDVKSMDDLFKVKEIEKEVVKEVNPYADILDAEDEAYFKYKKETGNNRGAWDKLNEDIAGRSAVDIARERVRNESGMKLTNAEADSYLEDTLGISIGDEMDSIDNIKLNGYAKPWKDKLLAEQEKYKKPLNEQRSKAAEQSNMVTLKDGERITAEEYKQRLVDDHNLYKQNLRKAVDSVAPLVYEIEIGDQGEKRTIEFKHEWSTDDRHSMVSESEDIDAMIERRYQTEDGFNHAGMGVGNWWGLKANQQKIITSAIQQGYALAVQEMTAVNNNENFNYKSIQRQPTNNEGYGSLTRENSTPGFGVKYTGFQKTGK